jgi:hypothetical protein
MTHAEAREFKEQYTVFINARYGAILWPMVTSWYSTNEWPSDIDKNYDGCTPPHVPREAAKPALYPHASVYMTVGTGYPAYILSAVWRTFLRDAAVVAVVATGQVLSRIVVLYTKQSFLSSIYRDPLKTLSK